MNSSSRNSNTMASRARPVTPNPPLSSSLPSTHHHLHHRSHRRHHSNTNDKQQPLSASIPLPKSHIHRTPSELQLADDMIRAEYEDVRMYARLVVGMQSQCMVSGYVHPLTKKSLKDILKTKQADDEELKRLHDLEEEDDDWDLSYNPDERDENSVDTPPPCQPMGTAVQRPTVVKTPSTGSLVSNLSNSPLEGSIREDEEDQDPQEDDFVFSLEL